MTRQERSHRTGEMDWKEAYIDKGYKRKRHADVGIRACTHTGYSHSQPRRRGRLGDEQGK